MPMQKVQEGIKGDVEMSFFDFMDMIGNYEERLVKNTRTEKFTVDTALVTDRHMPYETAIKYDGFRNGEWIVLG